MLNCLPYCFHIINFYRSNITIEVHHEAKIQQEILNFRLVFEVLYGIHVDQNVKSQISLENVMVHLTLDKFLK